jgi:hypothetical protein
MQKHAHPYASPSIFMPPKLNSAVTDQLSDTEEELLKISVRLDSAVWQRTHHREQVSDEWFEHCIDEELVCILCLFIASISHLYFRMK